MGGSCASGIDFPGAEFTTAAAAAFRISGALESGAEPQRELRGTDPAVTPATPHLPGRQWASLGICISDPGLRGSTSLLFSLGTRPRLKTDRGQSAPVQEVAEIREGGRARPSWVQLGRGHSSTDRPVSGCGRGSMGVGEGLWVWVRVSGPPSPQALFPAPPRVRGGVARKFELAGGGRAADSSSEMQVPDWVRTEPRGCHPRRAPTLPAF